MNDVAHYQSSTLVEVAYKALKSDIVRFLLLPGQKLLVRELSERYGTSGTPIKQALNRLVSDGLVESIPRRGMKVRVVEWDEIVETLDIRYMIEEYSVRNALRRLEDNPTAFETFETLIREHERVTGKVDDIDAYYRNYGIDSEFHRLFVASAGNRKTTRIYENLGTHGYMYYVFGKQSAEEMLAGVAEHRAILEALRTGNEEETRRRIKLHIDNAKTKLFKAFQANRLEHSNFWPRPSGL